MDFNNWDVVIGLEIHAQLKTKTKLFSSDKASGIEGENDQVHPVSLALPGTLPVLNEEALKMALKTGLAFKGNVKNGSVFSRKNYFYPDLPKGYQISQYDKPFCEGGQVDFHLKGQAVSVLLERIHLEEDAGRSLHRGAYSLINFNRAGIPLLEIVTKPVIKDPIEASSCARAIRRTLRYLEVCDGNLEEGSMRCDCNISMRPKGEQKLGVKVELKNINSFRFIEKALFYEIDRQIECLKGGQAIYQETRLYDSSKNQTRLMRSKEGASDYRYFPDPDLPQVDFDPDLLKKIFLPELSFERAERFRKDYNLKKNVVEILVEDKKMADYFEEVAKQSKDFETTSHWITGELQAHLKEKGQSVCPIPAKDFSDLLVFVSKGDISNTMAKEVFSEMWEKGLSPGEIIKQKNLKQISDVSSLNELVKEILIRYPKQVKDYKEGRTKVFGFFVGQIMKQSKGQANPQKVSEILKQKLDKNCE